MSGELEAILAKKRRRRRNPGSAWTPAKAPSQRWYSASGGAYTDAAKTSPAGNGDAIYVLADRNGNGPDFVQATAGSRPKLVKVDAGLGGKPSIDATDAASAFMQTASGIVTGGTFFVAWGMFQETSGTADRCMLGCVDTFTFRLLLDTVAGDKITVNEHALNHEGPDVEEGAAQFHLVTINGSTGDVTFQKNGGSISTLSGVSGGNARLSAACDLFRASGGSRVWNAGRMTDLIIDTALPDAAMRANINGYLSSATGVP